MVVVARTRVANAPLGEPFRVLTKEAAEKVWLSLFLGFTIKCCVDFLASRTTLQSPAVPGTLVFLF